MIIILKKVSNEHVIMKFDESIVNYFC